MDYYHGIVVEFLRANRATFVNTEYLIDLDTDKKFQKGRHWYCDALALNFSDKTGYLCEISYSKTLSALIARLTSWSKFWPEVCSSIRNASALDQTWSFRPWAFIPSASCEFFKQQVFALENSVEKQMPVPRISTLESVAPWNYCSWDRPEGGDDSQAEPL